MRDHQNCSVCRFLRSMAFSAIGGGVAGFSALGLGFSRENAITIAFFGALGLVMYMNRDQDKSKRK